MNQPMYLIYPGMTDFVEVEVVEPSIPHGYVWVRETATGNMLDVHIDRLCNRETMLTRRNVKIVENRDENGVWTTEERTVIA